MATSIGKDFRVNLDTKGNKDINLLNRVIAIQEKLECESRTELLIKLIELAERTTNVVQQSDVSSLDQLDFDSQPVGRDFDNLSDAELVNFAANKLAGGIKEVLVKGSVALAKRIYTAEKDTSPKSVRTREINAIIDEQMHINNQAKDPMDMRYINSSLVGKGGYDYAQMAFRHQSGIYNYPIVKAILDERADELKAHHEKLGLDPNHNTWVGSQLAKQRYAEAQKRLCTVGGEQSLFVDDKAEDAEAVDQVEPDNQLFVG